MALQQRHDELAAALQQAAAAADGKAFADARQRDLLARLQRVQAAIEQLGAEPEAQAARERYRLAAGALDWELAQEYTARLWAARKAFRELAAQIELAREREAALAQAQRDEPQRFAEFAARIPGLDARIRALTPRVLALTREQQQVVEGLAVAELARQKDRLAVYATQARFAVAQLYDHAKLKQEGDHAAGK